MLRRRKIDLEFCLYIDDGNCLECHGGGGKGGSPQVVQTPQVNPTPPVEETGLDMEEEVMKKKEQTGKSGLKIPLATSESVGIKPTDTGLKI